MAPPWKRKRPPGPRTKMTAEQKERARKRAARAGRRYPNLVDNMAIVAADKKPTSKKKSPKKKPSKKKAASKAR